MLVLLLLIVVLLLLALRDRSKRDTLLRDARTWVKAPTALGVFMAGMAHVTPGQKYVFAEQRVVSETYRYVGRFDQAVLHWDKGPVVDAVIERKFPTTTLPGRARARDLFQAGLYALALVDSGARADDTRLVVVYCLQSVATRCTEGTTRRSCLTCRRGRVFQVPFDRGRVAAEVERLDREYRQGRLRPVPSRETCGQCPFSRGDCKHSVL